MSKNEDYMPYDEYIEQNAPPPEQPLEESRTGRNNSITITHKHVGSSASDSSSDNPDGVNAASADTPIISYKHVGNRDGESDYSESDYSVSGIVDTSTGGSSESGVLGKLNPASFLKSKIKALASRFGLPAGVVSAAMALLFGSTIGVFGSQRPARIDPASCVIDPTPMVINEKYVWPIQQETDDLARAMYRALSTDAISVPFMEDEKLKTPAGQFYFPNDRTYEQYFPYGDTKTKTVEASHGFQVDAIMGMIANAHAEGSVIADGFEYIFGVGSRGDDKADGILSSSHHGAWDNYVVRMFELYDDDEQGTPIIKSTYKYRPRVLVETADGKGYEWALAGKDLDASVFGTDSSTLAVDVNGSFVEHFYPGMGLWGWTGALAYELQEFCDTFSSPWEMNGDGHNDAMYTMNGQLAFLLYSEDWFDHLDKNNMPSPLGSDPTLKKFEVEVPNALAISRFGGNTVYETCQKMYEEGMKREQEYLSYTTKDEQEKLKKAREDWNKEVAKYVTSDTVTAKEWAALSIIHYDFYNWVYHPESKQKDWKFGDVSHMFQNGTSPEWADPDPYEYSEYVLNASKGDVVYLINQQYENVTYKDSELWSSLSRAYNESDLERHKDIHPEFSAPKQYPYCGDWRVDYKNPDADLGDPNYLRRQSSFNPIAYDHRAADGADDFRKWDQIVSESDPSKIWNQADKDIWNYDVHVECIARDRFGRILTKKSTYKNELEVKSISAAVGTSPNGWSYDVSESLHTKANMKQDTLEKDDQIRVESRPWTADEFKEWHDIYLRTYEEVWNANINSYSSMVFNYYIPYCHACDSGDHSFSGDKSGGDEGPCSNHNCPNDHPDVDEDEDGECDTCELENLNTCDDCRTCDDCGEKYHHILDCGCSGCTSGGACPGYAESHKDTHDFYAKYVAGFLVDDLADEAALKAAEKYAEKINKELRFDVLADWGVDPAKGMGEFKDTKDCTPDADDDSDHDATSAGGLACETLAYDWSLYFEGIAPDAEKLLNEHMWMAGHYYEIYSGTQEEWYLDGGIDVFGVPEKKHRGTGVYTYEHMPHIGDGDMWYYGDESTGKSAKNYYVGTDGYWWQIDDLKMFRSHVTTEKAIDRDKTLDDWDINWKYPERWRWTSNYNMAEAITGLYDRKSTKHDNAGLNNMWADMQQRICGIKLDMSTIASTAMAICWPQNYMELATYNTNITRGDGTFVTRLCTEVYIALNDLVVPEDNELYSSCDRGATTIIRSSGADPFFAYAGPQTEIDYCEQSDLWWDVLSDKVIFEDDDERKVIKDVNDLDKLRPGDVLIEPPSDTNPDGHIAIFVGGEEVLTKYPRWNEGKAPKGSNEDPPMPYYVWFTGKDGRYAIVHSSAGDAKDLAEKGNDYARGLMMQTSFGLTGYRVFRARNADMNSIGGKWTANSKWTTLRNLPKGELRNQAYIDLLNEKAKKWQ